jgi:hypothetical protein
MSASQKAKGSFMSASDSSERPSAEPIDVEFEPADRPRRRARAKSSSGDDGIGFGAALALALFSAVLGGALGAFAPRIPAVRAAMDSVLPESGAATAAARDTAALERRLDALEAKAAPVAEIASASDAEIAQRMIAMQNGLRDLENRLNQIPNTAEVQALVREVQQLRVDFPAVAQQSRTAGEAARAAFAVSAAADASRSSGPFEQSYRALAVLLPDDPNVRALAPLARTGAPTRVELRDRFADIENDIIRAARQAEAGRGFWGRVQAALAQWVVVRRRGEGDTAVGVVERASRMLAADNLAGAVQELRRLSGPPARVAQPWLTAAQRRLEIDTRLGAIRHELARRG